MQHVKSAAEFDNCTKTDILTEEYHIIQCRSRVCILTEECRICTRVHLEKCRYLNSFPGSVHFTDRVPFSREGSLSDHDSHVMAYDNPTRSHAVQHGFTVNV
ncbi:hypothetical protein TNCV_2730061 [Trichonephila clavipes]|nr:hypothetical protein TNCV_2730061 [Trichonephila clavipes]